MKTNKKQYDPIKMEDNYMVFICFHTQIGNGIRILSAQGPRIDFNDFNKRAQGHQAARTQNLVKYTTFCGEKFLFRSRGYIYIHTSATMPLARDGVIEGLLLQPWKGGLIYYKGAPPLTAYSCTHSRNPA